VKRTNEAAEINPASSNSGGQYSITQER